MSDAAIDLLREPAEQEVASERPPAEVLASLQAADNLVARVDPPRFMLTQRGSKRSIRYPGAIYGVVQPAEGGSSLVFTIGVPEGIRLVLRVWAAISVLVIVLGVVVAGAALFAGEYQSALFALWLPLIAAGVWLHWRRMASRATELEEQFRQAIMKRV